MNMIPTPTDCCRPCTEPTTTNVPGAQGEPGADGADGLDGVNAYTTVTTPFVMPAEGANVDVAVGNSTWMAIGQTLFLGQVGGVASGYFQVVSKADGTHMTVKNVADAAAGEYPDNSAPGTLFPAGTTVSPGGVQGPQGTSGDTGSPTDATYLLQTANGSLPNAQNMDAEATGLVFNTTGTGVQSIKPLGTANTNVPPVDDAAGLVAGESVWATASGLESKTAAQARLALELEKGVSNGNIAPVDDGSGLTNGELLRATAAGIESIPIATVLAMLGLSGGVGAWLVYQNQQATGVDGGTFNSGSWVTVPLNTEVVDTGGHGSIAGNTVTLAAGTYRARWRVPAVQVGNFQSRLYNVTTTSVLGYGSNAEAATSDQTTGLSAGEARFTLGGASQVRLEAQCASTFVDGFGEANGFGGTEVYAVLELEKET